MFKPSSRFIAGLVLVGIVGLREAPALMGADRESTLTIEALASPAGAGSGEPQLTVQGSRAILSWLEVTPQRVATLKFAERTPAGWSAPQAVSSGSDFFVNSADLPSVRALADGTLAAHWLQANGPNPEGYDVRLSWSKDGGRTWSAPASPHHDGTKTEHGFVSLFQAPGAGLGVIWLDGRATNPEEETGNMSLRAATYDATGKQVREMLIDSRVCECCSTSVAQTSEGPIVAYRDRSPSEIRDIYVSRLAAGRWSVPTAVHRDGWKIEACPINGPAISAHGRDVAVAWFTAATGDGHSFVAFSHDAGRTFAAPVRVDDAASTGRLSVEMLDDGSAAVAWMEFANQQSQYKVRTVAADGTRTAGVTVSDLAGSRYPRLAHAGNELLLTWTEADKGMSQVRTARATLRQKP